MKRTFSPQAQAELSEILADFPNKKSALLMVLRLAEREFGSIDNEAMELVAASCEVSVAHVLGMVTFYTHFKRPFHGKHRFMVCATLMCSIGGPQGKTDDALAVLKEKLNLEPGERTDDSLFSVEKVECLADCNRPPVVQKDNAHHVHMNREQMTRLVEDLLKQEGLPSSHYAGKSPVRMDPTIPFVSVKQSIPAK
jgi:NADH-quinone oxidoreductase subunit E